MYPAVNGKGAVFTRWIMAFIEFLQSGGSEYVDDVGYLFHSFCDAVKMFDVVDVYFYVYSYRAVTLARGVYGMHEHSHSCQYGGDVNGKVVSVYGNYAEGGCEVFAHLTCPADSDTAFNGGIENVLAIRLVYRNSVASGDKAHDIVAGKGNAAMGETYKTVVKVLDDDAVDGLAGSLDLGNRLGGGCLTEFGVLLLYLGEDLLYGDTAVADGGVEVVKVVAVVSLKEGREKLFTGTFRKCYAQPAEFAFNGVATVGDVFVSLFLFEPLADLCLRFAGADQLEPVS